MEKQQMTINAAQSHWTVLNIPPPPSGGVYILFYQLDQNHSQLKQSPRRILYAAFHCHCVTAAIVVC